MSQLKAVPDKAVVSAARQLVAGGYQRLGDVLEALSAELADDAERCELEDGKTCLRATAEYLTGASQGIRAAHHWVARRATRLPKQKVESHVDDERSGAGIEEPQPSSGAGGLRARKSQPRPRKARARKPGGKGKRGPRRA